MRLITEDDRPDLLEILQKIQEEAAEIIQASSKIIRFGLNGQSPYSDRTNIENLADEISDLMAVVCLLSTNEYFADTLNPDIIFDSEKLTPVLQKFQKYSVYWKEDAIWKKDENTI